MQLEIGKKYRTRDGRAIYLVTPEKTNSNLYTLSCKCVDSENRFLYPLGDITCYPVNGIAYPTTGKIDDEDLTEEVPE